MHKLTKVRFKFSRIRRNNWSNIFVKVNKFFKLIFNRFQTPFNVNLLIAGYDNEKDECEFYVLDYLASMVTTKFAAHGYGGFFSTAILDNKYRDGEKSQSTFGYLIYWTPSRDKP